MSIKKFVLSRSFIIHLALAVALIAVILFIVLKSLNVYTRHGQSMPVPDFYNLSVSEANAIATQNQLKVVVIDSVFSDLVAPGAIVEQQPNAGSGVKQNRTIRLTINSTQKEMVLVPKLTEISFRQAKVILDNAGLKIGNISYQPSEYKDLVLRAEFESAELLDGTKVLKGSSIDLVIGSDPENQETSLPNLLGMDLEQAKIKISESQLNFGVLVYDESIATAEDSLQARVWRQRPDAAFQSLVKLGTSVDLWITSDKDKIKNALSDKEL